MNSQVSDTENNTARNDRYPLLTFGIMIITVLIYVQIAVLPKPIQWDAVHKFGLYDRADIWAGEYWSLFATAFIHLEFWHIAFNLYWFFIFAREIERVEGRIRLFSLVVTSAFFSGACELIFGNQVGIGLSGIVYALFGYIILREKTSEYYTNYITKRVSNLFVAWIFVCFGLSYLGLMNIANAAHVGGIGWGFFIASMCSNKPSVRFQLQSTSLLIAFLLAIWQPWSSDWLLAKGIEAHQQREYETAKEFYHQVIAKSPHDEIAIENLRRIRIVQLSDSAQKEEYAGNITNARSMYIKLEQIDPDNALARQKLATLSRR